MILKGLSKYDVYEEGECIKIRQLDKGDTVTLYKGSCPLRTDDGVFRRFSCQLLRYLIQHPETDTWNLHTIGLDVASAAKAPRPDGRRLKGLSRYEVYEENGEIHVWGIRIDRRIKLTSKGYYLTCDDGVRRVRSVGHLRYLMDHPEVDASLLDLKQTGIKFLSDGTPADLYGGPKERSYRVFRDLDDVQHTVDIMRDVSRGKLKTVREFFRENREDAARTVAGLLKLSPNTIRPYIGQGEEKFLNELKNANVQKIRPLYTWLCKCIKYAYLESNKRNEVRLRDWQLDRDVRHATYQPEFEIKTNSQ